MCCVVDCEELYDTVQKIYLEACNELAIVPNSVFLRHLPTERVIVRHLSINAVAAKAISVAMMVSGHSQRNK